MAKAAAVTFKQFRARYNTENVCRQALFRLRFPECFVCPVYGCREYTIPSTGVTPARAIATSCGVLS